MNKSHYGTDETSAALQLGSLIREWRKQDGLTIAELAEKIGRPREWLNRLELGYSEYGEHKAPTQGELKAIAEILGRVSAPDCDKLLSLGVGAEKAYSKFKVKDTRKTRSAAGKLTQAEIVIGEEAVVGAIIDLIGEQHSDAVIRNTGFRGVGSYTHRTPAWNRYRDALGKFLADNPNSIVKRIEYVASEAYLENSKESDTHLAGHRKLEDVHNARVKFRKQNPLSLHLLIGQREAILALPRSTGQPGSGMALVVRDRLFVEALRQWYDEVLWDGSEPSKMVDFASYDQSFQEIKEMYGF